MSKYYDKAVELRSITSKHYNCAQAVVIPFAEEAGITEDSAYRMAANFGGGMKRAATCGAITGGLMVLGLYDVNDSQTIGEYYKKLREKHQGFLECADLLKVNREQGREKKPHCDEMIYECVALVEKILMEKGILQ